MFFYALPQLPFFDSKEFTPETLKWAVVASAILVIPSLYLCIKHVPNNCHSSFTLARCNDLQLPFKKIDKDNNTANHIKNMLGNTPFLLFLGAFLLSGPRVWMLVGPVVHFC